MKNSRIERNPQDPELRFHFPRLAIGFALVGLFCLLSISSAWAQDYPLAPQTGATALLQIIPPDRPLPSDRQPEVPLSQVREKPWVPSLWGVSGFTIFLLGLAIIPLVAPRFWEHNRNQAIFTAMLGIPFAIYAAINDLSALARSLHEYAQFMTLLFSLFVIAGGVWLSGDVRATPRNNTLWLALGAVLASFIGTTGACMLLLRPLLSSNQERKHVRHTVIFFIFIAANIGGSLTPLGDPPLLLGYLKGVPFAWTFRLWRLWLPACASLIAIFYLLDRFYWKKESAAAKRWDAKHLEPLRIKGTLNFLYLLGVMAAVFFCPFLNRFLAKGLGLGEKAAEWIPLREVFMLVLVFLSWKTTKMEYRRAQNFTFRPILEVGILFLGVFITMIPALALLYDWGPRSPIQRPWQFFWAAGWLSSFLDNAPTYLTFLALGLGQPVEPGMAKVALHGGEIKEITLLAISAGTVFMGANTYIGNAPNFMVKAIAEENKIKMPSFFGYMAWSLIVLAPIFIALTLVFFRG